MFESLIGQLGTPIYDVITEEKFIELEYRTIILEKMLERIINHPQVADIISSNDIEEIRSEALQSIRRKYNYLISRKR